MLLSPKLLLQPFPSVMGHYIYISDANIRMKLLSDLVNTLRTGDADLRLYITTVQDG